MLILLALLFANPFIRRYAAAADGKKLIVIAVDHSFSMRAGDRLAHAKDASSASLSAISSRATRRR